MDILKKQVDTPPAKTNGVESCTPEVVTPKCITHEALIEFAINTSKDESCIKAGATDFTTYYSLPLNGLTPRFNQFVEHLSGFFNVPEEAIAIEALTVLGAVLGRLVKGKIYRYTNTTSLFTVIVAPFSNYKSEALSWLTKLLTDKDKELEQKYKQALRDYKAREKAGVVKPTEEAPKKEQTVIGSKSEADLIAYQYVNHRGLFFQDEIRGVFELMKRKGNESFSSLLLSMHDGRSIKSTTLTDDKWMSVNKTFLSLLGSIQPEIIPNYCNKETVNSGLFSRFFFVSYESKRKKLKHNDTTSISVDDANYWQMLIDRAFKIGDEGYYIQASPEAEKEFIDQCNKYIDDYQSDDSKDDDYNSIVEGFETKTIYHICRLMNLSAMLRLLDGTNEKAEISASDVKWAYSCAPYINRQRLQIYNLIMGNKHDKKPLTDRETVCAVRDMLKRKGLDVSPAKIAEFLGIERANASAYINGKK